MESSPMSGFATGTGAAIVLDEVVERPKPPQSATPPARPAAVATHMTNLSCFDDGIRDSLAGYTPFGRDTF